MIWFSSGREMNCLSVLRSVGRHQLTILTIKINLNRIGKKVVPFRSFFLFSFFCYFFFSWIFDSVGPALHIGFSWNELFLCNCQMALPAKINIVSWNLNNTTLFLLLLIFFSETLFTKNGKCNQVKNWWKLLWPRTPGNVSSDEKINFEWI